MNFYRSFGWLLFAGTLATGAVLFFADNYYTVYEPFFSKMLQMSFDTGTTDTPQHLDEYSPLCFIGWDKLLIILYQWRTGMAWYDYWMIALHLWALVLFTFACTGAMFAARQKLSLLSVFIYTTLWSLVFYWPLRQLNHTHTAHLVCGVSLAAYYFAQPHLLPHLPLRIIWRMAALGGFVAAAFIRWEVAAMQLLLYAVFVLSNNTAGNRWRTLAAPAMLFSILVVYVGYALHSDPRFFRQIEPDGEYEVLYHRTVKLSQATTPLDSLRIEMLNAWIVDDTNLISIGFFKQAVAQGRQNSSRHWQKQWGLGFHKLSGYVYARWYFFALLLVLFGGGLLISHKRLAWVVPVGLLALLPLVYQQILTERHLYPYLAQLLLWLVLAASLYLQTRFKWLMCMLLAIASALHIKQVQHEVTTSKSLFLEDKRRLSTLNHYRLQQYTIATEATYSQFFYSKPFIENEVLPHLIHLSFQQFSYTLLHQQYMHHHYRCKALNYGSIYTSLYNHRHRTLLIASPHRLAVIQKLLNNYYHLPIAFKEENNLEAKTENPAAPRLYRLIPRDNPN